LDTSAFHHLFGRDVSAVHFVDKLNGAAHESQGDAAGVIIVESVPFEPFLFVALAALAGKPRPSLANGVVKTLTIVAAKHVSLYLVATLHSHVALRFSHSHDRLLKFFRTMSTVPSIAARTLN
jgi:hypothetical protein